MTYNQNQFKSSNVNYINKDFSSLKSALINYAKSYFPNTYRDFNEVSPGMMLIEMSAYVGDVLSFYIDQQYREMMLPLAEERRNIINMAKMLGYKIKPITPAYVNLTFKQTVASDNTDLDNIKPDWSQAMVIDKNVEITSNINSDVIFETLSAIDFKISGSSDAPAVVSANNSSNLPSEWTLEKKVRAISGTRKTKQFNVEAPIQFLELNIPDNNIIEIISVVDSSGNNWYQVDFLAQDKIPLETHYSYDSERLISGHSVPSAYASFPNDNGEVSVEAISVPYSLEYIKTSKRYITQTNDNDSTSLIFGNGILRSGQNDLETAVLNSEQVGWSIPGNLPEDLNMPVDPYSGDSTSTLGEVPNNTTLTIIYLVGGGNKANCVSGELTTLGSITLLNGTSDNGSLTTINLIPAVGGSDRETNQEIKERAKAFFATQNRCVTKEDYEARILNMDAKYGGVAKVYVNRVGTGQYLPSTQTTLVQYIENVKTTLQQVLVKVTEVGTQADGTLPPEYSSIDLAGINFDINNDGSTNQGDITSLDNLLDISNILSVDEETNLMPTIAVNILCYNNKKQLIGDPHGIQTIVPKLLYQNIKNYLNEYRILTDEVSLYDGYIINFGVFFDVVAHKHANKQEVKLLCIQKIKDYFTIDKLQFRQPIYVSTLEYELMSVDGVRAVNYVSLTQDADPFSDQLFDPPLYDVIMNGGSASPRNSAENNGYGYQYNFNQFFGDDALLYGGGQGIVLPSVSPAVFELKNPNDNIRGAVR